MLERAPSKELITRLDVTKENELICEKLLGWERWKEPGHPLQWKSIIDGGQGWTIEDTPSFATWADVGLILEALVGAGVYVSIHHGESGDRWKAVLHWSSYEKMCCEFASSGPLAVRAAALEYIRSLK